MRSFFMVLSICVFIFTEMNASETSCPRCEILRDYHNSHPEENYYWYDDYLDKTGEHNDYQPKNDSKEKDQPPKKIS
jgi:hypothetical protein